MSDPREEAAFDEPTQGVDHPWTMPHAPSRKTGRRELVTSVVPVEDQYRLADVEELVRNGDLAQARAVITDMTVPLFRARALSTRRARTRPARRARWPSSRSTLRRSAPDR